MYSSDCSMDINVGDGQTDSVLRVTRHYFSFLNLVSKYRTVNTYSRGNLKSSTKNKQMDAYFNGRMSFDQINEKYINNK